MKVATIVLSLLISTTALSSLPTDIAQLDGNYKRISTTLPDCSTWPQIIVDVRPTVVAIIFLSHPNDAQSITIQNSAFNTPIVTPTKIGQNMVSYIFENSVLKKVTTIESYSPSFKIQDEKVILKIIDSKTIAVRTKSNFMGMDDFFCTYTRK